MKIETKTYIFLMFPLLIGIVLYFAILFHQQLGLTRNDYAENCNYQTYSLADLCTEAIAGGALHTEVVLVRTLRDNMLSAATE